MDFTDVNILDNILDFFEKSTVTGVTNLSSEAQYLVCIFAIIDLCTTWTLYEGEMRMSQMVSKVIKLGAFLFLVLNWTDINHAIMESFQYAGLTAANISQDDVMTPSKIINNGFTVVEKLLEGFSNIGAFEFGKALMYLITIALVLLSFFFIAIQVLLTRIEFEIFASLAIILLPFGVFRYTNFLCQRCISAVFAFGVKLMVMYFMIGLVQNMADSVTAISEDSSLTFAKMLQQSLGYVVMGFLVWKIPNIAAMMIRGVPDLDVSPSTLKRYGQKAVSEVTTVPARAGAAYGRHRATLELARQSVAQSGIEGSTVTPAGRNVGMAYMRETMHQIWADMAYNRSRYNSAQSARRASTRNERFKDGQYAKETFNDHKAD